MTVASADLDIHPELDPAWMTEFIDPHRSLWTPRQLRQLTSVMASTLAPQLSTLVSYLPERRWWTRLALSWGVEVWLLSWLPGQGTRPHDHGGAAGSFTVLTGSLAETYRYPGRTIRHADRRRGTTIGFGAGHAHEVRNREDIPASSVHAYSPPLVPTREYASLLDLPVRIAPLPARPRSFDELLALAEREA